MISRKQVSFNQLSITLYRIEPQFDVKKVIEHKAGQTCQTNLSQQDTLQCNIIELGRVTSTRSVVTNQLYSRRQHQRNSDVIIESTYRRTFTAPPTHCWLKVPSFRHGTEQFLEEGSDVDSAPT